MKNTFFFLLTIGFLFLTGCNDTVPAGTDVLPGSDLPDNIFTDTATLVTTTVREDSLRSDKIFLSQLGYKEDPIFGSLKASISMGFRPPNFGLNLETFEDTVGGYVLDSIFLAVVVSHIYGDTNKRMSVTAYKLASPLENDRAYYSNLQYRQGMVPIGRKANFYPTTTIEYAEDTVNTGLGAQIRIPLDPYFGQSLLNIMNTDQISSNELFRQYLPGVVVVPDEQPAAIVETNLVTNTVTTSRKEALGDTRIHMYFHNADGTPLDLIFTATVLDVGVNTYQHDYTGTNVGSALTSNDPDGDAVSYVEGLAGVKTKVTFPHIAAFGNDIAVLKAELVVTQINDGSQDEFTPPERLFGLRIDENGGNENTSDFSEFPAGHVGGFFRETVLEDGQEVYRYRINISDYFQRLIFGQVPNDGLYITTYGAQNTELTTINDTDLVPDRAVIGGGSNTDPEYRMKLELSYTKLD